MAVNEGEQRWKSLVTNHSLNEDDVMDFYVKWSESVRYEQIEIVCPYSQMFVAAMGCDYYRCQLKLLQSLFIYPKRDRIFHVFVQGSPKAPGEICPPLATSFIADVSLYC